ncbi:MAG: efflux RND transporter permease subunit, partial [Psychrosphaera sp.]|nr:efflux RND transporter permease subunit [Psychrosphaera sp.]
EIEMNVSSSEKSTLYAVRAIEKMIFAVDAQVNKEYGRPMMSDIQVSLRTRTTANIQVKLVDPALRPIGTFDLSDKWRDAMPVIPGVKTLTIRDNIFGDSSEDADISFRLNGNDAKQLKAAAIELKAKLKSLKGVGDINDSMQSSTEEVQLVLKPLAYSLGLNLSNVAAQVSFGFYGIEAQRIIRHGEEIKVMIRYPQSQRNSISQVGHTLIKTPDGTEVPLSEVAQINIVEGVSGIRREDGKRTLSIWASVNTSIGEPLTITKEIRDNYLPEMLKSYPRITSEVSGSIHAEIESQDSQLRDFLLTLLLIYALLAIPLKSYAQPFIIMSVIPFGVVGAMFGHIILGMDMSGLSIFGIIAAAGVVVNDSLVMVDFVNNTRKQGIHTKVAVVMAGMRRFRAIMLTSITTFMGLMPIIMETSLQAQIVIPMAVSLAFGVLFATVVTLILIPCLYVALEDFHEFRARRKQRKEARKAGLTLGTAEPET